MAKQGSKLLRFDLQTFASLSSIVVQHADNDISTYAMKLLNNVLLSSAPDMQASLERETAATGASPLGALFECCLVCRKQCAPLFKMYLKLIQVPNAKIGTVFRVFACLMRLITTNPMLHTSAFRRLVQANDSKPITTIALVDTVLQRHVVQPLDCLQDETHTPAAGGAAPSETHAAGSQGEYKNTENKNTELEEEAPLLGKAVLQFAFSLARGVASSLKGDPSPPDVKAQRMLDIEQFVGSLCRLLSTPQDVHTCVLPLQLEGVKVLAQMPLQATVADSFTAETVASGQAWSLATAVHKAGGLKALLKIVHVGLMGIVCSQPLLMEQYGGSEKGGEEPETGAPPTVPEPFQGVSPSAMFPPVMLLHRLLSAEVPLRSAALPTVMQGSGFVAVAAQVEGGSGRQEAPLLYDSTSLPDGQRAIPLFNCLKAAMQVNPPQELLKRFAGEVLFMGAGRDPQRYVALVGVGLALPMLQAAGLVEFAQDAASTGAAAAAGE